MTAARISALVAFAAGLSVAISAAAAPVSAQELEAGARQAPRLLAGGSLLMGEPQREFRDNGVPRSWGGSGNLVALVDRRGIFGIRLEGGGMIYGHETKRVPLSSTIGGRVMVDVSTVNSILFAGLGPQLMFPSGPLRPYASGTVGIAYFTTQSAVDGADGDNDFARDTNYDDLNVSYRGIGGLYIPLYRGRTTVALDFSAQYHSNGVVSYLKEGGIRDNPDGSITFSPMNSRADLVSFHLGVSVGLPNEALKR
jgi:hypothetical protein